MREKMFAALVFMVSGNMCCGVNRDSLMARPRTAEQYLACPDIDHTRPMYFTGRAHKCFIYIGLEGLESDDDSIFWVST